MCLTLSATGQTVKAYVNYFKMYHILVASKLLEPMQRSCLYVVYLQRYEKSCHILHLFDLHFHRQPSRSSDWFQVFWDPRTLQMPESTPSCKSVAVSHSLQLPPYRVIQWMSVWSSVPSVTSVKVASVIFQHIWYSRPPKPLESTSRSTSYHVYNRR